MATTLYLANNSAVSTTLGNGMLDVSGSAMEWTPRLLTGTNSSVSAFRSVTTITGGPITTDFYWLSEPLAADVTISGTINISFYGEESSMSANAAIGAWIQKVSATDFALTTIAQGIDNAEMTTGVTNLTFSLTPSSTTLAKGDRLRVVVYYASAPGTTMGDGYFAFLYFGDATYPSSVQFTENLSFMTFSGSQYVYPTNVASDVATADVDYKVWTSRGT